MLYLEDYLEVIENLPMEMRERFTEMRETDLEVQNTVDTLDEKVRSFFKKCIPANVKQEWKDEQFDKIKEEYQKVVEAADDKVQLANQIYDMVDRHLRKLDQELSKFKMELEADNAGITEMLEKRSLELDKQVVTNPKGEKRKYVMSGMYVNQVEKHQKTEKILSSIATEAALDSAGQLPPLPDITENSEILPSRSQQDTPPGFGYNLGQMGAQSNAAIAAAASAAIAATKQMQQGRRTASLKASYDAVTKGTSDLTKEFTFTGNESAGAQATLAEGRSQRTKKQTQKAVELLKQQQLKAAAGSNKQVMPISSETPPPAMPSPLPDILPEVLSDPIANSMTGQLDETGNLVSWTYDPNEPRYCVCNDVSYGEMVGCDNEDCPIEWFHYACVSLTAAPKGKWYCPQCTVNMKRRGRK